MIQEEVNNSDIEYSVIIVPAFTEIMANNDFWEGIAGQAKGPILNFCLLVIGQRIGGLNIYPFSANSSNEINLSWYLHATPFLIGIGAVNNAHIHRTATHNQLVVNNVLHNVSHLLLTESDACITETNILAIVFIRIIKIVLALYVPTLALAEEKSIRQLIHIAFHGVQRSGIFAAQLLLAV